MKTVKIYDLGQNNGNVSQMLIDIVEGLPCNWYLWGVEANRSWHEHCKHRFAMNDRVTCIHAAVGPTNEPIKLYHCPGNTVGDSIYSSKNNVDSEDFEMVQSVPGSEIIPSAHADGTIVVVKINIEGAEYDFFKSIIPTNTHKAVDVFIGTNDDVQKISELSDEVQEYYSWLESNKIKIHYFSDYEPHKNCDLESMIRKML